MTQDLNSNISLVEYNFLNLPSRIEFMDGSSTRYTYDDIDRLVEVSTDDEVVCETEYSSNGNIIRRDGIGNYTYGSAKPHAVTSVENLDGSITGASQATSFNGFGKVTRVIDGNEAYQMDITYGPDQQRWKSVLTKMGQPVRTTIYADDYEEVISADSTTRRFHYLDGGAVVVSQDGEDDAVYYAFTDNLGSVLRLVNSHGETAFEASYDAWGRQTVTTDSIGFRRGYTGHEMLPEFGLVNMNGRMYDPVIGRFISPDDYVQQPDNSQSYNRYSYCLNNPLKYTDPDGELHVFSAATGFLKGLYRFVFKKGSIRTPFKLAYKNFTNSLKITYGMILEGKPNQILSRFTWELPQTVIGYMYSEGRVAFDKVDHVRFFDGATFVIRDSRSKEDGLTLGNFININSPDGVPVDHSGHFAPYLNTLYMHEYGHYLQSQEYGWLYLTKIGIPSLKSAMKYRNKNINENPEAYEWIYNYDYTYPDNPDGTYQIGKHRIEWYEIDANKRAWAYFHRYMYRWNYSQYPINYYKVNK